MKTRMATLIPSWRRILLLILASTLCGAAAPQALLGGLKQLDLELANEGRTAKVTVPEGVSSVTLQRFRREGGWVKVASRDAVAGVMRFKLPDTKGKIRWRAIGQFDKAVGSRKKFPAEFYQGTNEFGPSNASSGSLVGSGLYDRSLGLETTGAVGSPNAPITEADIWKVDGNTVYFFNQLRGLQVLNLANPADPRITASLRLPASGQDLYLLPGSGPDRHLVLLTRNWSDKSGESTRINLVKVSGGQASITHRRDVEGYLADSRMSGNRLITATTEWNFSNAKNDDEWNSRTRLSEWLIAPDTVPQADGETLIDGDGPMIAAGNDWLALAVYPNNRWDSSLVSVFAIRNTGLERMAPPIRTEGVIPGKFAIQWANNILTTVSERNESRNRWAPVTVLENFRAWAPEVIHTAVVEDRLGHLRLAEGESLFATRFAGNKAYIVTFLRVDPLFVIDLSDPANPTVAGEIKVPGFSTHIEPLGDLLFAVGWESNAPIASLFDVADPASPQLLRRLALGDSGSYSEALWDEKALKVLPDAGLAMIPLSSYGRKSGESTSVVQLIDIDTKARDLFLRGQINHQFDARRADLLGNAVVSISQRTMVAADIADRDKPSILSEVSLAWPVDRVFEVGSHLLQIEDGNYYGGGRATCRISPRNATESILAEIDLGEGTVKAADFRDGKLYILRDTSPPYSYFGYLIADFAPSRNSSKLSLDIYDASALPALTLLGSRVTVLEESGRTPTDQFLWPQPNRPAVVLNSGSSWFGRGPIILRSDTAVTAKTSVTLADAALPLESAAAISIGRPYWIPDNPPRLLIFDTTDPTRPAAEESVVLGPDGSVFSGLAAAADSLVVLGNSQWKDSKANKWFPTGIAQQTARVVEVPPSGSPIVRPLMDLPGQLFAVTELDRNGFLAFTRGSDDGKSTPLQVSASDGFDAFSIATLDVPAYATLTAGDRRLFVGSKNSVQIHRLKENGTLVAETLVEIGWTPDSLRWLGNNTLIGGKWNAFFVMDANGSNLAKWNFPTWNPGVSRAVLTTDGDLLVPFGEYGVDRLDR